MPNIIQSWLINLVIGFVLRQVQKFGKDMKDKWATLKETFDTAVADFLPGTFFDAEAILFVNAVIDGLAVALADEADIEILIKDLAVSDWPGALVAAKAILAKAWEAEAASAALPAHKVAALALVKGELSLAA